MQVELFESIKYLLDHIKDVEEDVRSMTKESYMTISKVFADYPDLPDEALETLQYQDIISQQLSATIDAIESVQENINYYLHSTKEDAAMMHSNLEKLSRKLSKATEDAREKRAAFQGKVGSDEHDDIEFF